MLAMGQSSKRGEKEGRRKQGGQNRRRERMFSVNGWYIDLIKSAEARTILSSTMLSSHLHIAVLSLVQVDECSSTTKDLYLASNVSSLL